MQEFPLPVQADHLAPGAEAGIDPHDPFGAQGRRQQKLTQVFGENFYGFRICPLL